MEDIVSTIVSHGLNMDGLVQIQDEKPTGHAVVRGSGLIIQAHQLAGSERPDASRR